MKLRYREFPPPAPLRRHLTCLWLLEGHAAAAPAEAHAVLPDGSPELIIHLGDLFGAATGEAAPCRQPRAHFAGQLERRLLLWPAGRIAVLGVRFRPAGASTLVREPQDRLRGSWVGLGDLFGARGAALVEEAGNAGSPFAALGVVTRWLTREMGPGPDRRVAAAAERVMSSGGAVPVEQLAREAGIGIRHLERGFLREVGLSPKRLARIARFQRVFHAIDQRPERWAAIAADCGYYDASHLVRDFRELACQAPSRLVAEAGPLTRCFTTGSAIAGLRSDSSNLPA